MQQSVTWFPDVNCIMTLQYRLHPMWQMSLRSPHPLIRKVCEWDLHVCYKECVRLERHSQLLLPMVCTPYAIKLGRNLGTKLPDSGKLLREKNLRKFWGFIAICESFLHEIGGVASFSSDTSEQSTKVSLRKSYFCQITKVFSLECFPLYGTSAMRMPWRHVYLAHIVFPLGRNLELVFPLSSGTDWSCDSGWYEEAQP